MRPVCWICLLRRILNYIIHFFAKTIVCIEIFHRNNSDLSSKLKGVGGAIAYQVLEEKGSRWKKCLHLCSLLHYNAAARISKHLKGRTNYKMPSIYINYFMIIVLFKFESREPQTYMNSFQLSIFVVCFLTSVGAICVLASISFSTGRTDALTVFPKVTVVLAFINSVVTFRPFI